MFELLQFPSIIEGNNTELRQVAPDLINGLKLHEKRRAYVIGNLALTEGVAPHKNINSAPGELEYQLLLKSALLLASTELGKNKLTVTTGFPTSTYQLYREQAVEIIEREHVIEYDPATFSNAVRRNFPVSVNKVQVMPEIQGCILGLRHGAPQAKGNFFVVSLGFGTCEAVMSTESGSVQRTSISTNGLRYAVNLMMNELGKKYYLELQNEHQLDQAFQKGFLFSNRKRVDLRETRERVLQQYYQEVISPALRKAFQDSDFQRADKLYLVGGGAHYEDLLAQFNLEFQDVVEVIVPQNPAGMATTGYCINSIQLNNGDASAAVGIDLGNATTIVSFAKGSAKPTPDNDFSEKTEPATIEKVVPRQPVAKAAPVVSPTPAPVLNIVDEALESAPAAEEVISTLSAARPQPAPKTAPAKSADRLGKFLKTGMW
ncbi:MAG: hypothetical protein Q8J69_11315 [Sphingobacteriaceae bacterium]|nr:hypothetical protein [Sphingobacteriaceae bacterium]